VLASGSGTILEAIVAGGVAVDVVVADRACRLDVAAGAGVEPSGARSSFGADFDRPAYTADWSPPVRPGRRRRRHGRLHDRPGATMFDVYAGASSTPTRRSARLPAPTPCATHWRSG
jgi:hypothetical protein